MQKRFLSYINNADSGVLLWETAKENTSVLFLDRWVGTEGVLAVSSYPRLGEKLWKNAWAKTYSENETTFYDNVIITSPYRDIDKTNHHFVSMPHKKRTSFQRQTSMHF